MLTGLSTVKRKLTALVALSIVVMLAALPMLSWVLHRQMLDEVDDRVVGANKSFKAELDDDLSDLTLAAHVLGKDEATRNAILTHDPVKARATAQTFLSLDPALDVLIFDAGRLMTQVGCEAPPATIALLGADESLARGTFYGVLAHGCETADDAPPAMVLSQRIAGTDDAVAVVCMPLDDGYVENTAIKLGVGVALARGGARLSRSPNFPTGGVAHKARAGEPSVSDIDGKAWALARFEVEKLPGLSVVTALDVTDVRTIIRRNLMFAVLVLLFAGGVSVWFGSSVASLMSRALGRVNVALKKLEKQEYVHVDAIRTGDELDDLAAGFNTMVDGLVERDKWKSTMGKYMTASVMDRVLKGEVELGGETLTVTILFSDIRGFTTISEKMNAQELVALLNEYFTRMVGVVMDGGGVVDKYIGDAIMAVFGAPAPKPDDAVNAVKAAVRMRQGLVALNATLAARGMQTLRTGIGIHTGEVVAGNIGSDRRMEYTVIGDAVNLASRLESSTKDLGVHVLISEDTWSLVKHAVVTRPVKEITVKGRKQPVMTYEVLGIVGEGALAEEERPPPIATPRPARVEEA